MKKYPDIARKTSELLEQLHATSSDAETEILLTELHRIQYRSNAMSVFQFYLPLVSHLLYYKPACENEVLKYLIGPLFALGVSETDDFITVIQSEAKNTDHLSPESRSWVNHALPGLKEAIGREIEICEWELEED